MDKKTQDILFACLPKEDREALKRAYKYQCQNGDYNRGFNEALEEVFNSHNLTSDTEPEEMLHCSRDFVMGRYRHLTTSIAWNEGDVRAFKAETSLLRDLFGDKCLPDKPINGAIGTTPPAYKLDVKPEQPSVQGEPFKLWDKVRIKPNAKDFHNGYENGYAWLDSRNKHLGKTYQVIGVGKDGSISLNTSEAMWWSPIDLEPYTEPETKEPECIHPDGDNCKWKNICDHTQCYFDPIKSETKDNMEAKELNRKALYNALCELETASIKVRKALISMTH